MTESPPEKLDLDNDKLITITLKELQEIATPKNIRVTITVPNTDNNGNPLARSTLEQFEKMLLNNAGGFSKHLQQGMWLDSEKTKQIYSDTSTLYEIITENNLSVIANLRAQALVIKQEMKQEAVLFTIEPLTTVEFV